MQFEATSSCPFTFTWEKRLTLTWIQPPFNLVVEHDKVSLEPLFLQAKQSQYETNGLITTCIILEFLVI